MVVKRYRVPTPRQPEFVTAMRYVGASRRRTGALSWAVYRDGAAADGFTEVFTVRSWDEHLRQHDDRLTDADREFERAAEALAEGEPTVEHFLPPQ
jgi:hypothetical protein